jgi:hypothetical protein
MSRKIVAQRIALAAVLTVVLVVTAAPAYAQAPRTRGTGMADHGSSWSVLLRWTDQVWKRASETFTGLFSQKSAEPDSGASTNYMAGTDPNGIELVAPIDPVAPSQADAH